MDPSGTRNNSKFTLYGLWWRWWQTTCLAHMSFQSYKRPLTRDHHSGSTFKNGMKTERKILPFILPSMAKITLICWFWVWEIRMWANHVNISGLILSAKPKSSESFKRILLDRISQPWHSICFHELLQRAFGVAMTFCQTIVSDYTRDNVIFSWSGDGLRKVPECSMKKCN